MILAPGDRERDGVGGAGDFRNFVGEEALFGRGRVGGAEGRVKGQGEKGRGGRWRGRRRVGGFLCFEVLMFFGFWYLLFGFLR